MSSLCVTTSIDTVDSLRKILAEMQLNDPTRRLQFLKDENLVAIPIKDLDSDAEDLKRNIASHNNYSLKDSEVYIRNLNLPLAKKFAVKTPHQLLKTKLKEVLEKHGYEWTEDVIKDLPSHWERHGDLVLIPGTAFTLPIWTDIGTEVWSTVTKCLSCKRLARKSFVSIDKYRTPQVTMLHGDSGWVEQVDNGIRYTYDVTKCMFSAGNITEKLRVAGFKCEGEVVVDLYAGIGYFTLPYLVYTGVKHLHACEWNPDAVEALRRNLDINGVKDRCTVHLGDNSQVCPRGVADRVNLGLIPSSRQGWPVACSALKPDTGGVLHIHYNVNTKLEVRNGNNSNEPQELFRCEAKSLKSIDIATKSSDETGLHESNHKNISGIKPALSDNQEEAHEMEGNITNVTENQPEGCEREGIETEMNGEIVSKSGVVREISNVETGTGIEVEDETKETDKMSEYPAKDNSSVIKDDFRDELINQTPFAKDTEKEDKYLLNKNSSNKISDLLTSESSSDENLVKCECENAKGAPNIKDINKSSTKCDKMRDNVIRSKWYSWAKCTANEIKDMLESIHGTMWTTDILHIEHVKSYAPHVDHIILDLKCQPVK